MSIQHLTKIILVQTQLDEKDSWYDYFDPDSTLRGGDHKECGTVFDSIIYLSRLNWCTIKCLLRAKFLNNELTPVLTSDNIILSLRARVSPCFILIRFLSRHFMAYILPVSAFRQPYTSPKPPRPMIRWTLKSFIVNCNIIKKLVC